MQSDLAAYLLEFARPPEPGSERPAFDPEIAFDLGNALRDVARGYKSELLSPVPTRGAPSASAAVEEAQKDAVRYIAWCKANLIPDASPYVSIRTRYSVPRETVRGWFKARKDEIELPASPQDEDELNEQREEVCAFMEISGRNYHELLGARTKEAVRRRATAKRQPDRCPNPPVL